jgi:hypothetical protein
MVLVCQGNTVLDLGILSALNAAHGWILIHTVPDDIALFLKAVEISLPNVVILSQGSYTARHSLFRSLLKRQHPIRILTICTKSNHVCIDQSQIVQIQRASDLINLIQTVPHPRLPGEKINMEHIQEQLKQISILNPKANHEEEDL